ncbi:PH domain-containing protein [Nocardiopsis sp. NPDC058631]|uniref:PH domain-containing protein n=1 Tax=Nocardiopsis sp. NPDC058631 TaxID=3346566 RepID=UPI0036613D7A
MGTEHGEGAHEQRPDPEPPSDRADTSGGWVAPGSTSAPHLTGHAAGSTVPDRPAAPEEHGFASAEATGPSTRSGDVRSPTDRGAEPPHAQGASPAGPPSAPTDGQAPHQAASRDWWGPPRERGGPDLAGSGAPGPWEAPSAESLLAPERVRRTSPRSMVVGPINQLKGLLVPIAAGLLLGGFNAWVLGATGATVVVLLVGGFVTWRTTRYEVGEDRLEIRKGLIRRSRRTIPLERVRGVDVTSTLLHRLLGVAVVHIEAAAGSATATEDGKLDAVAADEAERLRRVLLHRKAVLAGQEAGHRAAPGAGAGPAETAGPAEGQAPPVPDDDTVTYFAMPRSWYLYGALSLGYLLTPFAVLATLFGTVQQTAGDRANDVVVDWLTTSDRGFLLMVALVFAGVLVLLMPVFAVVSYALTHWGFSLRGRDGSLVAERGLFTRRSVTLERRRIRGYELLDNPLERTRGAVRLRAVVTGLGDAANRAVLLPIGPRTAVEGVVDQALALFGGALKRHPVAALFRRLTRSVLPFALLAAVAAALGAEWLAVACLALAVLGIPLGVDRYRSLGHGYDGERVSVRSGSLSRSQATVERSAVIGWTWTQTLFQRGSSLADLQVTVGAGAGGYTAQDASLEESVAFAAGVTPEMVRPFLEVPGTPDRRG